MPPKDDVAMEAAERAERRVRDALRSDAATDAERLARVRAAALSRAEHGGPAAGRSRRPLVLGTAGGFAILILGIAVFLLADPRLPSAGVVVARAVAALDGIAAPGKITYQKAEWTNTDYSMDPSTGSRSGPTVRSSTVVETWRSYDGSLMRVVVRSADSSTVAALNENVGGRVTFGNGASAERAAGPNAKRLLSGPLHYRFVGPCGACHSANSEMASDQRLGQTASAAPKDDVTLYRRLLESGVVRVAGRERVNGVDCYVLHWTTTQTGDELSEVYVDAEGYSLVGSLVRTAIDPDAGDGDRFSETRVRVLATRLLEPSALPTGFFDPDTLPLTSAGEYSETIPSDDTAGLRAYTGMPLYWLGPRTPVLGKSAAAGFASEGLSYSASPEFIFAEGEWPVQHLTPVFAPSPLAGSDLPTRAALLEYTTAATSTLPDGRRSVVMLGVRTFPPDPALDERLWGVGGEQRVFDVGGRRVRVLALERSVYMKDPAVAGYYSGNSSLVVGFPDAVVEVAAGWPLTDGDAEAIVGALRRANPAGP